MDESADDPEPGNDPSVEDEPEPGNDAHVPDDPSPPDDLPPAVAELLVTLDGHDLRETIVYAQELLNARHEHPPDIEPGPGEEIVRIVEREGYTAVYKRQPCSKGCDRCPHGPYLYHVTREPHPDGSTRLHWTLIGRAQPPDE